MFQKRILLLLLSRSYDKVPFRVIGHIYILAIAELAWVNLYNSTSILTFPNLKHLQ